MLLFLASFLNITATWFVGNRYCLEILCRQDFCCPATNVCIWEHKDCLQFPMVVGLSLQRQTFKVELVAYVRLKTPTLGAHGRFSQEDKLTVTVKTHCYVICGFSRENISFHLLTSSLVVAKNVFDRLKALIFADSSEKRTLLVNP